MTPETYPGGTPCTWDIDGLRLAGLSWGRPGDLPVLALHGWMDHADSFRQLAPRLMGCHTVALDLSGQGHSDHRAAHATYNIWDDLPQIVQVLDALGWQDCVLVGHSRGANIAALFAAALPERVRALISLDCIAPEPVADDTFVPTLRAFVEQTAQQQRRAPRTFATRADYTARRQEQNNSRITSEALADRALEQVADGFRMRADRRLFASSAVKLSQGHIDAVLRAIQAPVLNIWASEGLLSLRPKIVELAEHARTLIVDYQAVTLPGDHHFHLDPVRAAAIADTILRFLAEREIDLPTA